MNFVIFKLKITFIPFFLISFCVILTKHDVHQVKIDITKLLTTNLSLLNSYCLQYLERFKYMADSRTWFQGKHPRYEEHALRNTLLKFLLFRVRVDLMCFNSFEFLKQCSKIMIDGQWKLIVESVITSSLHLWCK